MDNAITRFRRPRYSMPSRRRRKNYKENRSIIKKLIFQSIAAISILSAVVFLKSFNSPVANYITDKTKAATTQNIDIKTIFEGVDNTFNKVLNDLGIKKEVGAEDTAVPASADVYSPDGTNEPDKKSGTGYDQEQSGDAETEVDPDVEAQSKAEAQKYSLITPVGGTLGSPFGSRVHPIKKTVENHKGVDIEASKGASIKAVMDGDIIEAATETTYGKYIKIKHKDGLTTVYAHCSALLVKKGQKVKQGAVIAKVGDTGASVGAHLHFEIWKDGKPLNPQDFIKIPEK